MPYIFSDKMEKNFLFAKMVEDTRAAPCATLRTSALSFHIWIYIFIYTKHILIGAFSRDAFARRPLFYYHPNGCRCECSVCVCVFVLRLSCAMPATTYAIRWWVVMLMCHTTRPDARMKLNRKSFWIVAIWPPLRNLIFVFIVLFYGIMSRLHSMRMRCM